MCVAQCQRRNASQDLKQLMCLTFQCDEKSVTLTRSYAVYIRNPVYRHNNYHYEILADNVIIIIVRFDL